MTNMSGKLNLSSHLYVPKNQIVQSFKRPVHIRGSDKWMKKEDGGGQLMDPEPREGP